MLPDIKSGYVRRHDDLPAAVLMLMAVVGVFGLGMLYLGERVHGPEPPSVIVSEPPDPPLRIE